MYSLILTAIYSKDKSLRHNYMKSFAPGQSFTKYCIKPELSWSCRRVMVCWFILPALCKMLNQEQMPEAVQPRCCCPEALCLSQIYLSSPLSFLLKVPQVERERRATKAVSWLVSTENIYFKTQTVSLCLLCSISKHYPATPIPTFLLRL